MVRQLFFVHSVNHMIFAGVRENRCVLYMHEHSTPGEGQQIVMHRRGLKDIFTLCSITHFLRQGNLFGGELLPASPWSS